MDRIMSLQAFVQVVDSGSFSGAAKRLGVSPAVVTGHVQALEKRLGVQLLNRTTRKVNLTEVGRGFHGTLRLNTSVSLARLVTPLISDYVSLYPDVCFELVMSDRMVDMVEEGFDLALRSGPLPDSSLITRRLGVGRLVLCAAPEYLARHGRPERPEDLAEHNCLIYINSHLEGRWRLSGPDGEHDVAIAGNLRSNSVEGLRAAALAGLGICLLPTVNISEDLAAGHLVRLLPDYRTTEVVLQAVYPPGRHVPVKVRTFIDFLVERLCQGRVTPMLPKVANM